MNTAVKIYLWLMVLMSVAFGTLYLGAPAKMIEPLGYGVLPSPALADLRTTFAAFQLAMAVFLWWCWKTAQMRVGVMSMFLSALSFVVCRGYGLYIDGDRTPMLVGTILFETTLAIISIVFYALMPADLARVDNVSRVGKIVLAVLAIATLAFGVFSTLMPGPTLAPMGFPPLSPAALTDARASYGGFQIGLALFMLWSLQAHRAFAGALNFLLCIGLVVLCRALAMIIGNVYTQAFIGALIFESVLLVIAAWLFLRARNAVRS